jgi:hexokinase
LHSARINRALSLQDLAKTIGVSPSYLSKIETGAIKDPSASTLIRLANYFHWTIGELYDCFQSEEEATIDRAIEALLAELADVPQVASFNQANQHLRRDLEGKKLFLEALQKLKNTLAIEQIPSIKQIEASFTLGREKLQQLSQDFQSEMEKRFAGEHSSLKLIRLRVNRPTGHEQGEFIGLDFAGPEFRVLRVTLEDGKYRPDWKKRQYTFSEDEKTGTSEKLFKAMAQFFKDRLKDGFIDTEKSYHLGLSIAFAIEQKDVNSSKLIEWSKFEWGKGLRVSGVIGQDVASLLREAFKREGINNITISATANDTIATQMAVAYLDQNCRMGLVVGPGFNFSATGIKLPDGNELDELINFEAGSFDKDVLVQTQYDVRLDRESVSPGEHRLEKKISGTYMPEIVRLIVSDFASKTQFFNGWRETADAFGNAYWFTTEYMSEIAKDDDKSLRKVEELLNKLGVLQSSPTERQLLQKICHLVAQRSARLVATALVATIEKMQLPLTVAVDGNVYAQYPNFEGMVKSGVEELLGKERGEKIHLFFQKDASGFGAAVMAAVAANNPP